MTFIKVLLYSILFTASASTLGSYPYYASGVGGGGVDVGNGRILINDLDYKQHFYSEYELLQTLKRDATRFLRTNRKLQLYRKAYNCQGPTRIAEFEVKRLAPVNAGFVYRIEYTPKLVVELKGCRGYKE